MFLRGGKPVYSPTDLINSLMCEHLTTLDLDVMKGKIEAPARKTGTTEIVARLGIAHEKRYLASLAASGLDIVSIGDETNRNGAFAERIAADAQATIEAFVDYVMRRRERFPGMHVYHYASYEPSHLAQLAQRHATREDEIDTLLAEERFVDLYGVVKQSIAIGQSSYSIKKLEPFFGAREAATVATGDESILHFEAWLESRVGAVGGKPEILEEIERYNEQDCVSTYKLLVWLGQVRSSVALDPGPPAAAAPAREPHVDAMQPLITQLEALVPADVDPVDPDLRNHEWFPFWMMLQLLAYHWREKRPEYWEFHDTCRQYAEEPERLLEDRKIIVGLEPIGEPFTNGKLVRQRFRFPSQEINGDEGSAKDAATKQPVGDVEDIIEHAEFGELTIRNKKEADPTYPRAVIVQTYISVNSLRESLGRFATAMIDGAAPLRTDRAAYDLLLATDPRFRSRVSGARLQPEIVDHAAIMGLIEDLDDSYLFIQGPPGSGKTYQAAHAIVRLLQAGKRIGITAPSHAAIDHVLHEIEAVAGDLGYVARGERKLGGGGSGFTSAIMERSGIRNSKRFSAPTGGELRAGTVWAFASASFDAEFDYVFIDEAGQMPLANAIVAARATKSVVLLGDPLQLPQVQKGTHLANAGSSVLEYLLLGAARDGDEYDALRPVAPDRGVLLDRSWRMHPDVCEFISSLAYEGRLGSAERCAVQTIEAEGVPRTGIRYVPIVHNDGKARSETEAREVVAICGRLLAGGATRYDGSQHPLRPEDVCRRRVKVNPFWPR